jgi:hypothetical protein
MAQCFTRPGGRRRARHENRIMTFRLGHSLLLLGLVLALALVWLG